MKNTPTFLNFANERAAPGRAFVLHTRRPAFLSEVFIFNTEAEIIEFGKATMGKADQPGALPVIASRSRKPWNGKHYFFLCVAIFESFEYTQKEIDRLARITRRLSDWYLYNVLNKN